MSAESLALGAELHAVYRFYDDQDQLLYVGITHHPSVRWSQHRRDKVWWADVRTILVEPHPSRTEALAAEAAAIKPEVPRYNILRPGTTVLKTYRVSEDLYERVREKCDREGKNVTDVIRDALERYVDDDPHSP